MASAAATPSAHGHAGHDDHGHDHVEFLDSLNPPPSYWPAALAGAMLFLPVGALLSIWGAGAWHYVGWASTLLGVVLSTVAAMGWCHSVIVDKWMSHFGPVAQGRDLVQGTLLFRLDRHEPGRGAVLARAAWKKSGPRKVARRPSRPRRSRV